MNKKYQVFISSTFLDLKDERQDVVRSVLDVEHIPAGMEAFHAVDLEQFAYIKKVIDECDYYVLIIGARYGSTAADGISYTEKEYDYAVAQKKTVLAFIHSNPENIPQKFAESNPDLVKKLEEFRTKVSTGRLVSYWSGRDQLQARVIVSLTKAISQYPGVGWVRGDAVASESLLAQINDLRVENEKLRSELAASNNAPLVKIENLAPLDEPFALTFKVNTYDHEYNTQLVRPWGELFDIVGPKFLAPQSANAIKNSLEAFAKGVLQNVFTLDLSQMDAARVRVQLEALGLLKFQPEPIGGGEKAELTPKGRAMLAERLATRAAVG